MNRRPPGGHDSPGGRNAGEPRRASATVTPPDSPQVTPTGDPTAPPPADATFSAPFRAARALVSEYFAEWVADPEHGSLTIAG